MAVPSVLKKTYGVSRPLTGNMLRPKVQLFVLAAQACEAGIRPSKRIANTFHQFCKKVHKEFPECRIYFLSIKPSIARWNLWSTMRAANNHIAAECTRDKRLIFVDIASDMLNDAEKPRKEIFKKDKLHMTRKGYVIWRNTLKPILLDSELQHEKQTPSENTVSGTDVTDTK